MTKNASLYSATSLLSRHHIIPYTVMRDFFNEALTNHDGILERILNNIFSRAVNIYDRYYGLHAMLINNESPRDNLILQLIESSPAIRQTLISQSRTRGGNPYDRHTGIGASITMMIQAFYNWLPGNIFLGPGPSERSDDPGNSIEVNAIHIIGDENYHRLEQIYNMMLTFIKNPNRNEETRTRELNDILTHLIPVVEVTSPYQYDPSKWESETVNNQIKWKIRTTHIHDENRKRRATEEGPEIPITTVQDGYYCSANDIYKNIEKKHIITLF